MNLSINGDLRNVEDLQVLDGLSVGGVTVSVTDLGGGRGRLALTGSITELRIGGQELWIDRVCLACCMEGERPRISIALVDGLIRIRFCTHRGRTYHLESIQDLSDAPGGWSEWAAMEGTGGYASCCACGGDAPQYFRVRVSEP